MKKVIKKLFIFVLLFAGIVGFTSNVVFADEEATATEATETATTTSSETDRTKVNIYMFRGEGCGYCAKALDWFESIKETEGKYYNLVTYEVWNDENNKAMMDKVANYMGDDVSGVPYIIVGEKTFQGFDDGYKAQILDQVHSEYTKNVDDRFDVIKNIEAGIDKKKDNAITYVICGIILLLIVFVIIARNKSGNEETVNFEYDEENDKKHEEFDDIEREEIKDEEVVVEEVKEKAKKPAAKKATKKTETKAETKKAPTKKATTKKTTTAKKPAAKTSTGKRGRPPKKK